LTFLSKKAMTYFHYVERHCVLAKMIAGSVVLREQRIFMLAPDRLAPIPWDLLVVIRPHFRRLSTSSFNQHGSIGPSKIAHWDVPEHHRDGTIQCKHCLTEFKVSYKSFGVRGTALCVTRWMDLGRGESPSDPEWQSHVRGIGVEGLSSLEWPLVPFARGSICAAFEGEENMASNFSPFLNLEDERELFRKSPYSWPKNV
jgi:hypothetical protein